MNILRVKNALKTRCCPMRVGFFNLAELKSSRTIFREIFSPVQTTVNDNILWFFTDPFELRNRLSSLKPAERSYLHDQLEHLKGCKGTRDCTVGSARLPTLQAQQHQRYITKRKYSNSFGKYFISLQFVLLFFKCTSTYISNRKFHSIRIFQYFALQQKSLKNQPY